MMTQQIKQAHAELNQYSKLNQPLNWPLVHLNFGGLYMKQLGESPSSSSLHPAADKIVEHTERALEVLTESTNALVYASRQCNLSSAYRLRGTRADTSTKAPKASSAALRVFKPFRSSDPDIARDVQYMMAQQHSAVATLY